MTDRKHYDYLIVGQGLAGSAVALQLLQRKLTFIVLDEPHHNNSSRIAAGLFNPVTGQNSVKTWLADTLFPYLNQFYSTAENLTGQRFFFQMPLYRPFLAIEEQNEWMGKSADQNYRPFIDRIFTTSPYPNKLVDPYGGILLKQTGYLNTGIYIDAVRSMLKSKQMFAERHFDEARLIIHENFVEYDEITARRIIFCQGVSGLNQWFKNLPIRTLKGETISVQSAWKNDVMLNRGVYMVPGNGEKEWRVGSTYQLKGFNYGTSAEALGELQQKLSGLIKIPFQIIGQDWGVRPTTTDRRPIVGNHPQYKPLVIFNGLGTKGVSLAPYFSEVLIRSLENDGSIEKEADITRYKMIILNSAK